MAKKNKTEKIKSIDEQIKELQEKKKLMIDQLYISVGKTIVSEWNSTNQEELENVIVELKEEAIRLLNRE